LALMNHAQTRNYHARSRNTIDPLFGRDLPTRQVFI
jgi:hypothetical protein